MFKLIKSYKENTISFFRDLNLSPWKEKSFVFQGYIIQFLIFSYSIFRYLSRSYESYGFLSDQSFSYYRWWLADLYPLPVSHFSTFQFIYDIFPRLNPDGLMYVQYLIVGFSFLGLLGILPRISAFFAFIFAVHLEGILISSDAEISGGTCLFACLIMLALCKKNSLYRINKIYPLNAKSSESSLLIFLFSSIIGIFYFSSGVNKLVDCGINWPFTLGIHLEGATVDQTQFLFNQRLSSPLFTKILGPQLSILAGFFTLYAELSAILFITNFRYKYLTVILLIIMHTSIYFTSGINFTGNTFLLLGILNWNFLFEKGTLYYDDECIFCIKTMNIVRKYLKPRNIEYKELSSLKNKDKGFELNNRETVINLRRAKNAIALLSENDLMYGYNSVANILIRSKFFFLGFLLYLPPINLIGIIVYRIISKNRKIFFKKTCIDNCKFID